MPGPAGSYEEQPCCFYIRMSSSIAKTEIMKSKKAINMYNNNLRLILRYRGKHIDSKKKTLNSELRTPSHSNDPDTQMTAWVM